LLQFVQFELGISAEEYKAFAAATGQGLTLVHSSAQLKRLLCDRGCS